MHKELNGSRVVANLFNGPVNLTASAPAKARGEACTGCAGSEDSATSWY